MERRTFLVLGASLLGMVACTADEADDVAPSTTSPRPPARDPDGPLRGRVAAAEIAMIARYRAAIAARPGLADTLAPHLAHHEAHLARVSPGTAVPGTAVPEPSGETPPGATPTGESGAPAASDPPGAEAGSDPPGAEAGSDPPGAESPAEASTVEGVLRDLVAAEQEAQAERVAACDAAASGALARDLCLIAASEAQHAAALETVLARRR